MEVISHAARSEKAHNCNHDTVQAGDLILALAPTMDTSEKEGKKALADGLEETQSKGPGQTGQDMTQLESTPGSRFGGQNAQVVDGPSVKIKPTTQLKQKLADVSEIDRPKPRDNTGEAESAMGEAISATNPNLMEGIECHIKGEMARKWTRLIKKDGGLATDNRKRTAKGKRKSVEIEETRGEGTITIESRKRCVLKDTTKCSTRRQQ